MLQIILKYRKQILIALMVLIGLYAALSIYNGVTTYNSEYNRDKAVNVMRDARERESRDIINEQVLMMQASRAKIDSLNAALSLKQTILIKINSDVQLLKGDSAAILDALDRVFAGR